MASRRSIRRFTARGVAPALLRDLVRIGITAPSATNCQTWTFTLLPDPAGVTALSQRVAAVYRRICRLSAWRSLCTLLRWLGKPELDDFSRVYRPFIETQLAAWEGGGADPFFRGAPAAIVVASRPGASGMHSDDAHLATQNILLAAHAMGLGTCLIGLALVAFRRDPSVAAALGLPANETVQSVIALGYPDEHYRRLTARAEPAIRVCPLGGSPAGAG
jgi:nitroreductase